MLDYIQVLLDTVQKDNIHKFSKDMYKISPFFPLKQRGLKIREFLNEFLLASSNFEKLTYSGPKLTVYEEDALLAIVAVLNQVALNHHKNISNFGYTYNGSLFPILKIYCGGRKPSVSDYKNFLEKLKLLRLGAIKLSIFKQTAKEKKIKNEINLNLLTAYIWDDIYRKVIIYLNPYIYEVFLYNNITFLDASIRSKLINPISKALHSFIIGLESSTWKGDYLSLAKLLNHETNLNHASIKHNINSAVKELQEKGILHKKSGFVKEKSETIQLIRYLE